MSSSVLQETHLSDKEHEKLKRSWADKVYYSSHKSGRKRGVSILIHRSIDLIATATHKDAEGRYILVNGTLDRTEVSLMNIHARGLTKSSLKLFSIVYYNIAMEPC